MKTSILKSELAGSWYVDDPVRLSNELRAYIDIEKTPPVKNLLGLLLPHAGYRYSGMVAASGVQLLEGRTYDRVIVIGPSHQVALPDCVSIPDVSHIETPLGRIELDREAISNLWKNETFVAHPYAHQSEHSVQIELPFLQEVLSDFKLIPIVCGQLNEASAALVGNRLLPLLNEQTLLVVSSDFTHYGRAFDYVPFEDDIPSNLKSLDMGAFRLIEQNDCAGFLQYVENTGATICGRSPIAVLLSMLGEDARVKLLKYDSSGHLSGDWTHCVSYLSAAVTGRWKSADTLASADSNRSEVVAPKPLSGTDKLELLALARHRIAEKLKTDEPELNLKISPAMRETMGAFVTLHKQGILRGCIGEIFPRRPLFEAVSEHAVNAAFHDPRFPEVREDELEEIDVEISALTSPKTVSSCDEIEIGKHGIVLTRSMYSAVFLPQVAPEQGWDLETTLSHLAMKAGLGSNDWKNDCEFQVFEAVVFGEL
ncbi:AmmeMemoRadiSam system protein B [Pontiellaceae bacterium B12227]|nr:AmmeMemoRadiSam system protein B [Pontiellaceae bacterium B12227]